MNLQDLNFVSIDFETMTAEHTSACAVGIVKVVDGTIQQKFYSLIKPIPDDREKKNTYVHGITPEMVENAPTFGELWGTIGKYFTDQIIVCHNADFDKSKYYNPEHAAQYYNGNIKEGNHRICVVGWDDNYSKDNFINKQEAELCF